MIKINGVVSIKSKQTENKKVRRVWDDNNNQKLPTINAMEIAR